MDAAEKTPVLLVQWYYLDLLLQKATVSTRMLNTGHIVKSHGSIFKKSFLVLYDLGLQQWMRFNMSEK